MLGVLVPSRGRPVNLKRFLDAHAETATDSSVYVRLDSNDHSFFDYQEMLEEYPMVSAHTGPRVGFGASLNELAMIAADDGMTHLGMFGDDVLPITPGWDVQLVLALQGRLGVTYGDDGLRDKHAPDLPTHYVTQTEVYRRLGYLSPPGIRHLFLDNVAREIGRHLDNFRFVPVELRHLHPWVEGEHLQDRTYAEGGRNTRLRRSDRAAYLQWSRMLVWKAMLDA